MVCMVQQVVVLGVLPVQPGLYEREDPSPMYSTWFVVLPLPV